MQKAAAEFTDVDFIFIDGWAFDGLDKIAGIAFKEEQCGYFAGYAVVKEGYTKLGFTGGGGGTNPACCRYGYGFVEGANAAAAEMGVNVEVNYSWEYGASFSASQELQAMASGWYETGTEIILPAAVPCSSPLQQPLPLTTQLLSALTLTSPSSLTLLSPPL